MSGKRKSNDSLRVVARYGGENVKGVIAEGDALAFLRSLADGSADLVFLDPPFNLGKVYAPRKANLDARSEDEYRTWMEAILTESVRILGDGGTLYLYHVPVWAMRFGAFLDAKLAFRQWIAMSMKNGFMRGNRLYPAHYALMVFGKGRPRVFRRPRITPKRCRHCNEYVKDYGGYTHIIERQGINLSDFWEDLSPVRHASRKNRAANELPDLLLKRVFEMSGDASGHYVDPFAGAGTGVVCAARLGQRFSACDIVRANCLLIKRRVDDVVQEKPTKGVPRV